MHNCFHVSLYCMQNKYVMQKSVRWVSELCVVLLINKLTLAFDHGNGNTHINHTETALDSPTHMQ